MSLQTVIYGVDGEQLEDHGSQEHRLGTKLFLPDGRTFRYCKAGGALAGLMRAAINANYAPGAAAHVGATVTGYEGSASAGVAAGGVAVQFPDTGTRPVDYYQDGYLVTFPSGHYQVNRIRSSNLGDGATVTVQLEEPLKTAILSTTGLTAYAPHYGNVKAAMSTRQEYEAFICVPTNPVSSGRWFWGQTAGPCAIAAHGGTWPGSAAHYRDVFFHMDGTIDPSSVASPASGYQRAGYLLNTTGSGYGDLWIQLQME